MFTRKIRNKEPVERLHGKQSEKKKERLIYNDLTAPVHKGYCGERCATTHIYIVLVAVARSGAVS